jgi:hypothetical protein
VLCCFCKCITPTVALWCVLSVPYVFMYYSASCLTVRHAELKSRLRSCICCSFINIPFYLQFSMYISSQQFIVVPFLHVFKSHDYICWSMFTSLIKYVCRMCWLCVGLFYISDMFFMPYFEVCAGLPYLPFVACLDVSIRKFLCYHVCLAAFCLGVYQVWYLGSYMWCVGWCFWTSLWLS